MHVNNIHDLKSCGHQITLFVDISGGTNIARRSWRCRHTLHNRWCSPFVAYSCISVTHISNNQHASQACEQAQYCRLSSHCLHSGMGIAWILRIYGICRRLVSCDLLRYFTTITIYIQARSQRRWKFARTRLMPNITECVSDHRYPYVNSPPAVRQPNRGPHILTCDFFSC